jgi:LPLT family lysophospholipid transporter-like MFS transporter
MPHTLDKQLFSRGMLAVMVAQFISALADNALLFAAIALLKSQVAPAWQLPLLQEFFVLAFILLAPFVGPFADTLPKGRVMLIANSMVGLGAATYSPAKYGILSELVSPAKLVKANSMMEGSTIVAILIGAILGGILADRSVEGALTTIAILYLVAAFANLFIPRLKPAHPLGHFSPWVLWKDFARALKVLLGNPNARFSVIGTSIFWGAGSTLRFLLVAWVPVALHITDISTPANMSGAVAIGVALGAIAAARFVTLTSVNRALPVGVLIGLLIMAFAAADHLYVAIAILVFTGACGGFYVVPLNALLQEYGHKTVGSGHAIAIQNLFENGCMLIMIGFYIFLERMEVSVITSTMLVGLLVFLSISLLAWQRLRQPGVSIR